MKVKNELTLSAICSALFATILVACGGGRSIVNNIVPSSNSSAPVALLAGSRTSAHVGIGAGWHPIMAAFFQSAPAAVNLTQSFDAICDSYSPAGIPAGAFVPVPAAGTTGCTSWQSNIDTVHGKRIHDPGTLADLAVDISLSNGTIVSCEDKTDTASVADTQNVEAYYQPDSGKLSIAANGALTSLGCAPAVPAGVAIASIEAQWVKQ